MHRRPSKTKRERRARNEGVLCQDKSRGSHVQGKCDRECESGSENCESQLQIYPCDGMKKFSSHTLLPLLPFHPTCLPCLTWLPDRFIELVPRKRSHIRVRKGVGQVYRSPRPADEAIPITL